VLANSSAFKVPVSPSGVVYLTNDLVVANVSSKSKTVIPLGSDGVLDLFITLLNFILFFKSGLSWTILNLSLKVLLSKATIDSGSISTLSLKYLSHHLLSIVFQPSGIFVAKPAIVSFLLSAASKAINLKLSITGL